VSAPILKKKEGGEDVLSRSSGLTKASGHAWIRALESSSGHRKERKGVEARPGRVRNDKGLKITRSSIGGRKKSQTGSARASHYIKRAKAFEDGASPIDTENVCMEKFLAAKTKSAPFWNSPSGTTIGFAS